MLTVLCFVALTICLMFIYVIVRLLFVTQELRAMYKDEGDDLKVGAARFLNGILVLTGSFFVVASMLLVRVIL